MALGAGGVLGLRVGDAEDLLEGGEAGFDEAQADVAERLPAVLAREALESFLVIGFMKELAEGLGDLEDLEDADAAAEA